MSPQENILAQTRQFEESTLGGQADWKEHHHSTGGVFPVRLMEKLQRAWKHESVVTLLLPAVRVKPGGSGRTIHGWAGLEHGQICNIRGERNKAHRAWGRNRRGAARVMLGLILAQLNWNIVEIPPGHLLDDKFFRGSTTTFFYVELLTVRTVTSGNAFWRKHDDDSSWKLTGIGVKSRDGFLEGSHVCWAFQNELNGLYHPLSLNKRYHDDVEVLCSIMKWGVRWPCHGSWHG